MSKYCFGIDVGGTTIKCALFLNDGTILDKWEISSFTTSRLAMRLTREMYFTFSICRFRKAITFPIGVW